VSNFPLDPPLHPEEAALVRLVDGELPAGEAREIEGHLEGCAECRAEVEELLATLAECIVYREEVLDRLLTPPPQPWADLAPEFARIDREIAPHPRWRFRPALRWGLAAAAVLTFAIVWEFRETPSVQAASLLHRAEIAASKRPAVGIAGRRVRIRTKTIEFTLAVNPAPPALEALFREARWNLVDPLSARAFAGWRDSLKEKTDSVTPAPEAYQIRTTTPEGPLAAASLTLRAADLEPVEARLEFRDQEWVELSEASGEPAGDGGGAAIAPHAAEPPAAPGAPSLPPSALPGVTGGTVPASAVIQVLAALHEIGADLGEQVEVNPVDGRLAVTGMGIPLARQRQIQGALEKFPNVTVQFSEPTAQAPGTPAPDTATPPAESPSAAITTRVERQLGGRPQFERFSSQMLDWDDQATAQAYALRRLAERFPASDEARLSAPDRRALRQLASQNATTLADLAGKMVRTLDPVLAALGAPAAGPPSNTPDGWQPASEDLLQTARRVERRLSVMLGAAPADGTPFSAADLRADLKRLSDDAANCRRLLGQE
jgi:hypothetical protein